MTLQNVLAIGPKVCEFKSRRGQSILRATNIRCTPSCGGKVNIFAPCKILQHVKEPFEV
jgi:hypothetical protein